MATHRAQPRRWNSSLRRGAAMRGIRGSRCRSVRVGACMYRSRRGPFRAHERRQQRKENPRCCRSPDGSRNRSTWVAFAPGIWRVRRETRVGNLDSQWLAGWGSFERSPCPRGRADARGNDRGRQPLPDARSRRPTTRDRRPGLRAGRQGAKDRRGRVPPKPATASRARDSVGQARRLALWGSIRRIESEPSETAASTNYQARRRALTASFAASPSGDPGS